jgi:hypothetical protein
MELREWPAIEANSDPVNGGSIWSENTRYWTDGELRRRHGLALMSNDFVTGGKWRTVIPFDNISDATQGFFSYDLTNGILAASNIISTVDPPDEPPAVPSTLKYGIWSFDVGGDSSTLAQAVVYNGATASNLVKPSGFNRVAAKSGQGWEASSISSTCNPSYGTSARHARTAMCWFNSRTSLTSYINVFQSTESGVSTGIGIQINPTAGKYWVGIGIAPATSSPTWKTLPSGWHHWTVTYGWGYTSGGSYIGNYIVRVYLDGEMVYASSAIIPVFDSYPFVEYSFIKMDATMSNSGATDIIDQIRMYDAILSDTEIADIVTSGT